jgi:predicted AlkP superfamily phosphohydrolase/phosphomutase
VLFSTPDFAQHAFWKYMDPSHPHHDAAQAPKFGGVIYDMYRRVDEKIARLLGHLREDDVVIVMSDHGAGPLKGVVNLNKWLESEGLLRFSGGSKALASRVSRSAFRFLKQNLPMSVKGRLKDWFPAVRDQVESRLMDFTVDWPHTQAFAQGAYGNVWLNVKGREPQGTVDPADYDAVCDRIERGLLGLRLEGEPVVGKVHRRREIYHGPFLDFAPDLVIEWKDYAYHSRQRFGEAEETLFEAQQTMPLFQLEMNGFHRMNGMLVARGAGIRAAAGVSGARIVDLAPTILYCMGLPVPDDMDGQVLREIFTDDFLAAVPLVRSAGSSEGAAAGERDYSEDESEQVKDRLRGLGYLE